MSRPPSPLRRRAAEPVRLTLRLPADTVRRLREVARQRGVSVNGLMDEAASLALLEFELLRHELARPDGDPPPR